MAQFSSKPRNRILKAVNPVIKLGNLFKFLKCRVLHGFAPTPYNIAHDIAHMHDFFAQKHQSGRRGIGNFIDQKFWCRVKRRFEHITHRHTFFDQTRNPRHETDHDRDIGDVENAVRIGDFTRDVDLTTLLAQRHGMDETGQLRDKRQPDQHPDNVKEHMTKGGAHRIAILANRHQKGRDTGADIRPEDQGNPPFERHKPLPCKGNHNAGRCRT